MTERTTIAELAEGMIVRMKGTAAQGPIVKLYETSSKVQFIYDGRTVECYAAEVAIVDIAPPARHAVTEDWTEFDAATNPAPTADQILAMCDAAPSLSIILPDTANNPTGDRFAVYHAGMLVSAYLTRADADAMIADYAAGRTYRCDACHATYPDSYACLCRRDPALAARIAARIASLTLEADAPTVTPVTEAPAVLAVAAMLANLPATFDELHRLTAPADMDAAIALGVATDAAHDANAAETNDGAIMLHNIRFALQRDDRQRDARSVEWANARAAARRLCVRPIIPETAADARWQAMTPAERAGGMYPDFAPIAAEDVAAFNAEARHDAERQRASDRAKLAKLATMLEDSADTYLDRRDTQATMYRIADAIRTVLGSPVIGTRHREEAEALIASL